MEKLDLNENSLLKNESRVFSLKIDKEGRISCIYLSRGEVDDLTKKIARIIIEEFKFGPAKLRSHKVVSVYNIKI